MQFILGIEKGAERILKIKLDEAFEERAKRRLQDYVLRIMRKKKFQLCWPEADVRNLQKRKPFLFKLPKKCADYWDKSTIAWAMKWINGLLMSNNEDSLSEKLVRSALELPQFAKKTITSSAFDYNEILIDTCGVMKKSEVKQTFEDLDQGDKSQKDEHFRPTSRRKKAPRGDEGCEAAKKKF